MTRFGRLAAALFLIAPGLAQAACEGTNLYDAMTATDPVAQAEIAARAAQMPNGQGKFWRVEKAGVPASYLFGTLHDTDAHQIVAPEVWQRLAEADTQLFELSQTEKLRMEADMAADPAGMMFDLDGEPLSSRLPGPAVGGLQAALALRGLPFEAVELMKPWMLFAIFGFPACQFAAIQTGQPALDDRLAVAGIEAGGDNGGLETYDQSLAALERVGREALDEMLVEFAKSYPIEEDMHRTRFDLYDRGEIALIYEFGIWQAESLGATNSRRTAEAFTTQALDRRNRAWMTTLRPALAEGDVFVGVGALHLPGAVGLVELIRAEGYTVTRLDG